MAPDDELIPMAEYCRITKCSRPTAYNRHKKNIGPPMVCIGSRQFYRKSEVMAWIAAATSGVACPAVRQNQERAIAAKKEKRELRALPAKKRPKAAQQVQA